MLVVRWKKVRMCKTILLGKLRLMIIYSVSVSVLYSHVFDQGDTIWDVCTCPGNRIIRSVKNAFHLWSHVYGHILHTINEYSGIISFHTTSNK